MACFLGRRLTAILAALVLAGGVAVMVGRVPTAAASTTGTFYGWGSNSGGQFGNGSTNDDFGTPTPVLPPQNVTFTSFAAGNLFTVALDSTGKAWAWGDNTYGQFGNNTTQGSYVPKPVSMPVGTTFKSIAAGYYMVVAIDTQGNAWAWGRGYLGNGGQGTSTCNAGTPCQLTPTPVTMPANTTFTAVSNGFYDTLALDSTGHVWGWGANTFGGVGDGSSTTRTTPVQAALPASVTFTAVSAYTGNDFGVALDSTGQAWSWGFNEAGQLGNGTATYETNTPGKVTQSGVSFVAIAAGGDWVTALDPYGRLWGWGDNSGGALGLGTTSGPQTCFGIACSMTPVQAVPPTGVSFAAITRTPAALDSLGNLYTWATGSPPSTVPTAVPMPTGVTFGSFAGFSQILALPGVPPRLPLGTIPPIDAITASELFGGYEMASRNSCNCGTGRYPVDTATGNQFETRHDLSIPGRGIPLDMSETYNSLSPFTAGPLGFGWNWSYGINLTNGDGTPLSGSPTSIAFNQETGSQEILNLQNGTWTAPPRAEVTVTHNGDGTWTVVRLARQTFTFDASGRLTGEKDLNGETTTMTYPNSSTMVITDPGGRSLTVTLDPTKTPARITQVADSSSPARTVQFRYDSNGNLTDAIDVAGGDTSYGYDANHRLVLMRSPRFAGGALPAPISSCTATPPTNVVSTHYDSNGRVDCQFDPDGRKTSFSWTGPNSGLVISAALTDPKGNVTVYNYTNGEMTSLTKGSGTAQAATWQYRYDPATVGLILTQDPNGHTSTAGYDGHGNRTSLTDPLQRTTSWTYDTLDDLTSVTKPKTYGGSTVTTTYSYDEAGYSSGGRGNLTTVSTPMRDEAGNNLGTQTVHYQHATPAHPGDVTAMIDPGGNSWTYTYDSVGDRAGMVAPATSDNSDGAGSRQNTAKYAYDTTRGWLTATLSPRYVLAHPADTACTPPAVGCTTYQRDNFGHVTVTTDGNGHITTNHFDADRNLDYTIDGNDNKTSFTFDPAEQRTVTTRADNTTVKSNFWPDGTIEDQIDGNNADTHYVYDPLAHLSGVTDPDNRTTGYSYDPVGNLLVKADPGMSGCTTTSTTKGCTIYGYDGANELNAIHYNDPGGTPDVTGVLYDLNGQRASMTEQHGTGTATSTWNRDSLGRLYQATDVNAATVGYSYDSRSDLTSITYPGTTGTATRDFDPAGRIDFVKDPKGNQTNFTYDADSNTGTQSAPAPTSPVVDTYGYDNADALTSTAVTHGTISLGSATYVRDNANQLTTASGMGVSGGSHSYGYNPLDQLASDNSAAFTYDHADNLTGTPSGLNQGFDPANQLCWNIQAAVTGSPTCANPPAGASTFAYNSRGDRTQAISAGGLPYLNYSYDQANRLSNVTWDASYTPVPATRIADTRAGSGKPYAGQTLPPNSSLNIQVTGQGGVPAGATAAVINLSVANANAWTVLTVYPAGTAVPGTANLVAGPGQNPSNQVTAAIGANGQISVYNSAGNTDITVDVEGYYANTGNGYTPVTPARICNTRLSAPANQCNANGTAAGTLKPGTTTAIQVTGNAGVPAGATAAVVDLGASSAVPGGTLTAYPDGATRPAQPNLSYAPAGAGEAVASWGTNRLDLFARGNDNAIWHTWWTGSTWSAWENLGGVGTSNPAAISRAVGLIDVYARGSDGNIWEQSWTGTAWTGWSSLGAPPPGTMAGLTPAVSSWASTRTDLFVQGADNAIWHKFWNNGTWSGWESLGGSSTSSPAAISRASGLIDVYTTGTYNGLVFEKSWTGTAWTNWTALSSPPPGIAGWSGAAVSSWASNRTDLFVRGADNNIWHMFWNGTGWSNWDSQGPAIVSTPTAVSQPGTTTIDLFGTGTEDNSWRNTWTGTAWTGWSKVGAPPPGIAPDSDGTGVVQEVTVPLAANGRFDIYNTTGTTDLTVDIQGYYTATGGNTFTPTTPTRVADTRCGSGKPYACQSIGPNSSLNIQITGANGDSVPNWADAAVIDLTEVQATNTGSLTVYPAGQAKPGTTNLDTGPGIYPSNQVTVALGTGGQITVYNTSGTTDITVDVEGYFAAPFGTYTYNGDGLRMTKTVSNTTQTFVWDQSQPVPLLLSDQTNTYIYGPNNLPLEQLNNSTGTVTWLHHDQLGSTVLLTDTNGNTTGTATYDPYGKTLTATGSTTLLGYAAQYTDTETGLIYMRARYYDPTTAQFISRDPVDDLTRQAFSYADDNPLNGTDPSGLDDAPTPGNVIARIKYTGQEIKVTFGLNGWKRSNSLSLGYEVYRNGELKWADTRECVTANPQGCTGIGPENQTFAGPGDECPLEFGDVWTLKVTGYGPGSGPWGKEEIVDTTVIPGSEHRGFWDDVWNDLF